MKIVLAVAISLLVLAAFTEAALAQQNSQGNYPGLLGNAAPQGYGSGPSTTPGTLSPFQSMYGILNYGNTPPPQPQNSYHLPTAVPPAGNIASP